MNCLCRPSKSKENETGALTESQQKEKRVKIQIDEDDQTFKEYIPPAVPNDYNIEESADAASGGDENSRMVKMLGEDGGSDVEDTDSQYFFDAKESIGDFKSVRSMASSAAYQDAKSVLTSTQGDITEHDVGGIPPPQSTESNEGMKLSAALLSQHDHEEETAAETEEGKVSVRTASQRMVSIERPNSMLKRKESLRMRSLHKIRSMSLVGFLKKPRVKIDDKGFPGNLTQKQLDAVMEFRAELKKRETSTTIKDGQIYCDMVSCFQEVEEEPYALCRFLRARDFNVDEVFKMMAEHVDIWKDAKQFDFYPDVDTAMGCPLSILLTQYPVLYSGNAKDGFPICYFHAGRLTVEGIECITELDSMPKMMWHTLMYKLPGIMADATEANPDFVRCEQITVINLEGLSASQVNSRTLDVVKRANSVAECVPEILYRCIIINAPTYFAMTWRLIRAFLDPTTAMKIEIYSNKKKGQKRLTELIDDNQLPSDFDGNGPSTNEILCKESAKDGEQPPKRRIIELMRVKKAGGEGTLEFDLKSNEKIKIQVYTKTDLGARFSLHKYSGSSKSKSDMTTVVQNIDVKRAGGSNDVKSSFAADLVDEVKGEGQYLLTGTSDKKAKTSEHFLVIGDVY